VEVRAGGGAGSKGPVGFAEAMAALSELTNVESMRPEAVARGELKLDRMRAICAALGDPQRDFKCVHVAGSKGKGSVCEMTAAALAGCGYTVGLYTSPHLVSVRERVRLNGRMIDEASMGEAVGRAFEAAAQARLAGAGPASYFEVLTSAAFWYFAAKAVDIAVIEVGLGGRLDSTNVVEPEVCGLTAIQLEHTQILGDTLEKIAAEKAGIMKPGVTAISVPQEPGVLEVFRRAAQERGATLKVLGEDVDFSWRFTATPEGRPGAVVSVVSPRSAFEHMAVPLAGEHQASNCGLALALVDQLKARGFEAGEREVSAGLARAARHGRAELVLARPRVMVDGAHTPESVAALLRAVSLTEKFDSLIVIFGCAADKNVGAMLTELDRGADKVIFTRAAGNARAADPAELLARYALINGGMAQAEAGVREAINAAAKGAGRNDLILVTGSFYVAGEAKGLIEAKYGPVVRAGTNGSNGMGVR
jgi:dihydrofolate synthase/folylpolyglutamate synthase